MISISVGIFQFTASYEADRLFSLVTYLLMIFQFTASYEADLISFRSLLMLMFFQFTASYEADPRGAGVFLRVYDLSIHSLIRG